MRRVSVKLGLKERMNEILGTDVGDPPEIGYVTSWSIQSAMMENTRRVVRGIVGDTDKGRVLRGLKISGSGSTITIPPGVAFTPSGDIIVLGAEIKRAVSGAGLTHYVYIQHQMSELPEASNSGGKKTTFINSAGTAEIVYDDLAAALGTTIPSDQINILTTTLTNPVPLGPTATFLGTVVLDGTGVISLVTPTNLRGFGPFVDDNMMTTHGIHSRVESVFDVKTTINDSLLMTGVSEISGNGSKLKFTKDSDLTVVNSSSVEQTGQTVEIQYVKVGDTPGTLTFVKGILVAYT